MFPSSVNDIDLTGEGIDSQKISLYAATSSRKLVEKVIDGLDSHEVYQIVWPNHSENRWIFCLMDTETQEVFYINQKIVIFLLNCFKKNSQEEVNELSSIYDIQVRISL